MRYGYCGLGLLRAGEGGLTLEREMRHYSYEALHYHELCAMVHFVLFDAEQHIETGSARRGGAGRRGERFGKECIRQVF